MTILIVTLGLVFGSFLNVCIWRIPRGESIVFGSSHCVKCDNKIKWYDLIPVISFIALRGKCRQCSQRISIKYPMIELLNGALWLFLYIRLGLGADFIFLSLLVSSLIVISFIDIELKIIPDSLIIFLLVVGIVYVFIPSSLSMIDKIIGFFAVSLPLYIIALIKHDGIGGGDIMLMAVAGLFIGWHNILLSLLMASIIGILVFIPLSLMGIYKKDTQIPFGPFLAFGIFVSGVFGNELINWYISILI